MAETTASQPETLQPTRVFSIPAAYRWIDGIVMVVLSLVVPVFFLWAFISSQSKPSVPGIVVPVVLTLILGAIGVLVYISLVASRLAIGPGGISYFTVGGAIRAPWARVAGYGSLQPGSRKGLILYRDPTLDDGARGRRSGSSDPKRLIPLFPFERDWQEGEIGRLIRRYAPQALRDLGPVKLADFDGKQKPPDFPIPNPAPDASALAEKPKLARLDKQILLGNGLLTVWALVLLLLQIF